MSITNTMAELDETRIAQAVGIPADTARMTFRLASNTVSDYGEFSAIIGEYINHQYTSCISIGGRMSSTEAIGRAKEILEQEYRRRRGNILTAFNDARDGTNGGLRQILDVLCEKLKSESVEFYIRDVFDRNVAPHAWEEKVEIIRQFIEICGPYLSASIRADLPERFAHSYEELIREYTDGLTKTSRILRRL